jgi:hypothetical protein
MGMKKNYWCFKNISIVVLDTDDKINSDGSDSSSDVNFSCSCSFVSHYCCLYQFLDWD